MLKSRPVAIPVPAQINGVGPFGEEVSVSPGVLRGVVALSDVPERYGSRPLDGPMMTLSLDFLDRERRPWRLETGFAPERLWFDDGTIHAFPDDPEFEPDARVRTLVDARRRYRVQFSESGEVVEGNLYYTGAEFAVMLGERDMLVRVRWNVPGRAPFEGDTGGAIGFHRVPYTRFLWQPCWTRANTAFRMYQGPENFFELFGLPNTPREFVHLEPAQVSIARG